MTTSSRIGSLIGMTEVIGSTPVDVDRLQRLDEGEDGVDLALQMRGFRVADGDVRETRNAANGGEIDGHRNSTRPAEPRRAMALLHRVFRRWQRAAGAAIRTFGGARAPC